MNDIQKKNAQPSITQDDFIPIMPIAQHLGEGWFPLQDCRLPTNQMSTPSRPQPSIEPSIVEDL